MNKAVVIDDEQNSQELLVHMLTDYIEGVEVVGVAGDVTTAVQLIKATTPELVLLDVEIRGGSGFDVLKAFEAGSFAVVVVTGYNGYSKRYPQYHFVFKPVGLVELAEAIRRALEC